MKKLITPLMLVTAMVATADVNASQNHNNADGHHHKAKAEHHAEKGHGAMEEGHHKMKKDDTHSHGAAHGNSLAGKPGKPSDVSRTIEVAASDNMRFTHKPFNIKNGETIKFVVTNQGAIAHEFSIGTKDEHVSHSKMMVANPNMHHGPGGASITVKPGSTETLIWSFEKTMQVEAACNIPGHYQAGMHSPIMFVE